MTAHLKKALWALVSAAAIIFLTVILYGVLFVFLMFLGAFGAFPVYVTKVIPVVLVPTALATILAAGNFLPKKAMQWVKRGLLAICALAAVYIAWGAYRDSIPTLDDRELLLWQYRPFMEDTKAVSLDEPSELQFEYPAGIHLKMDGATALYPVYAAFVQAVYADGTDGPPYTDIAACTNTANAYDRLIARDVDVIFAAAPSADQLDKAARAGIELHLTPIGREAFVFFVNSKNPVEELTVEEIQKIYTGEITNWREVGGKNQPVRPFQRAANSGSQSALERLMDGLPLMEPEREDRVSAMDGIIRQVANYRNFANALGFSFRFYATEMVADGDIRLLAVNGVPPAKQTIRDGSYPLTAEFYAVTASPTGMAPPESYDQQLGAFLDWILSEQGQAIVEKTGYVSLY